MEHNLRNVVHVYSWALGVGTHTEGRYSINGAAAAILSLLDGYPGIFRTTPSPPSGAHCGSSAGPREVSDWFWSAARRGPRACTRYVVAANVDMKRDSHECCLHNTLLADSSKASASRYRARFSTFPVITRNTEWKLIESDYARPRVNGLRLRPCSRVFPCQEFAVAGGTAAHPLSNAYQDQGRTLSSRPKEPPSTTRVLST